MTWRPRPERAPDNSLFVWVNSLPGVAFDLPCAVPFVWDFQMINGCDNMNGVTAKPSGSARRRARGTTTSRTVTLQMLLDTNILEPGDSVLSLEYMVWIRAHFRLDAHDAFILRWPMPSLPNCVFCFGMRRYIVSKHHTYNNRAVMHLDTERYVLY